MPLSATFSFVLISAAVVVLYLRSLVGWRRRSCGRPFPPGPVCAPLVGNILTMPKVVPWAGLYELCKKYEMTTAYISELTGDITYLRVLGQHILVLGSAGVAIEFLEKRSANTADRPWSPVTELSGQDLNPALMPYGPWWRQHRRVFWQHYYPGVLSEYRTLLRDETRKFLKRLAYTSPDERVTPHIRRMFCSIFLKLAYDIDVIDEHDQNVTRIEAAFKAIEVATPGHFAVDVFPFLRHLPAWFPGAGFQRTLALSKAASDHLKHELFASVIEALENNEDRNCMAANMLRTHAQSSRTPEEEEVMKNICAVSIEAGVDTSVTTLRIFFVAMAMYPDIQRKAQAELDAVVGADRLPDFSDMDLLVYVRALLKEIHRWHTVVPLSIPHRTMHDDVFHGYFIPAGTTAIPNVWAIMHDPETYENPDEFNPGRFIRDGKLDTTVCDPESFIFGFGRRICPGRHFANVALQIAIASLLHIFNIAAPVDEDGLPIHIEHTQEHGLLS
ncbi:CyP450 monooxygenase [Trametes maxima]|nr:CyP450 monooxygenase [Trametes maxima]